MCSASGLTLARVRPIGLQSHGTEVNTILHIQIMHNGIKSLTCTIVSLCERLSQNTVSLAEYHGRDIPHVRCYDICGKNPVLQ